MEKNPFSFRRTTSRRRNKKPLPQEAVIEVVPTTAVGPSKSVKKKIGGALRLWMKFDSNGESELIELDKSSIINRVGIPPRDLRILGPVFSNSSSILARERAMVVNLEFIKAIVTAEEENDAHSNRKQWTHAAEAIEGGQQELPFEFQVLEIALEVVCLYLDSNVADLERDAYPALDELARNVSTKNLERVRSLKSNLTRLLARVQKVRDEIEHLLDDNEDMAQLYLSRRLIQYQQSEALMTSAAANSVLPPPRLHRQNSYRSGSIVTGSYWEDDIEDLEMLLEAYFMQLDRTRNKILSVREYIDDTEDYVNIQLDNQRNELIQLQLTLTIASFAITIDTLIAGVFGMNIPCKLYNIHGIFGYVTGGATALCFLIFLVILGYARWKKLLGS